MAVRGSSSCGEQQSGNEKPHIVLPANSDMTFYSHFSDEKRMIHLSRPSRGRKIMEKTQISSAKRTERRRHLSRVQTSSAVIRIASQQAMQKSGDRDQNHAMEVPGRITGVWYMAGD